MKHILITTIAAVLLVEQAARLNPDDGGYQRIH